jgi:hypothetical protein
MKPNQEKSRKLNLNKQTIQKLDNTKLVNVITGNAVQGTANTFPINFLSIIQMCIPDDTSML